MVTPVVLVVLVILINKASFTAGVCATLFVLAIADGGLPPGASGALVWRRLVRALGGVDLPLLEG